MKVHAINQTVGELKPGLRLICARIIAHPQDSRRPLFLSALFGDDEAVAVPVRYGEDRLVPVDFSEPLFHPARRREIRRADDIRIRSPDSVLAPERLYIR